MQSGKYVVNIFLNQRYVNSHTCTISILKGIYFAEFYIFKNQIYDNTRMII